MATYTEEEKRYVKSMVSGVPLRFLDDLFSMVGPHTGPTELSINLDMAAKWLGTPKYKLIATLKQSYMANVDYTIQQAKNPNRTKYGNNYKQVLLTPNCFKELCMRSSAPKASLVRQYFLAVEDAFYKFRLQTIKGMEADINTLRENQKPKVPNKKHGYVYILRAHDTSIIKVHNLVKIKFRRSEDDMRINGYNTGSANNMEFLYQVPTEDVKAVEQCVKIMCKKYQYRKRKEIFEIEEERIREVMEHCAAASNAAIRPIRIRRNNKQKGGQYYALISEQELLF